MNFFQQLEQLVLKIEHPAAKQALASLAAELAANKTSLVAKFATAGVSAEAFIVTEVTSLVSKYPEVAPFAPFVMPLLTAFIEKELGYAGGDIGTYIDKVVAWLIAEEANV